ncbi:MAG: ABC transporter substrate-binding protein, partial [Solirubrobacteraceae bacterium]
LAACGSSGGGGSSATSNSAATSSGGLSKAASNPNATIVANFAVAPATLDPDFTEANQEVGIDSQLYSMLTQASRLPGPIANTTEAELNATSAKPYLATSWQFSNGDKTLTFHLREGLKFPSGDPLDAQAVKWSLERDIASGSGGASVFQESQFKPPLVSSISAPNPTTVVINYVRPAPNQPAVLSSPEMAIYDQKLVEAHGGQKGKKPNLWLATHSAGYGPYLLKSYQAGHQMVLEANPSFFEPAKTKHIIVNFISDNETLLLDARSGAANVTFGLSAQAAHSLVGNSCCTVAAFSSREGEGITLPENSKNPALENEKFRQALSYAVPYEGILKSVADGYAKLYFGEWMPSYSFYNAKIGAPRAFSIAKAKQLLKESGIKTPVSLPLYVPQGSIPSKEIATAVAGTWKEIGVNASVSVVSAAQSLEIEYESHAGPEVIAIGPQIVAPDYYWGYDLQCPNYKPLNEENPYNDTGICLPAADKLMKQLAYVKNPEKAQQIANEADEMYIKAVPQIWIYNQKLVTVLGKGITSFYSNDMPEMRFWATS